jgi:hypothetical protein
MENSLEGKCADNFVERKREVFISRQRENLGNKAKESKGIFKKLEIYGMLWEWLIFGENRGWQIGEEMTFCFEGVKCLVESEITRLREGMLGI